MATQTFEEAGFRFVAGEECTINGQRGREWIAQRRAVGWCCWNGQRGREWIAQRRAVGWCCWIRLMAAHIPLRATRKEIVNEFDTLGLFD